MDFLDRRAYPGFTSNWDDSLFRERILSHLNPNAMVLDLGAGSGIVAQMNFRGLAAHVAGVDPDPRVEHNAYLDERYVGFAEKTPYNDESFDLVFCNNVFEHISDPDGLFREVSRILRPNGLFLAKTPNRRHYVPLLARATPFWFHRLFNKVRGRHPDDTFPTLYRLNTPEDVRRYAERHGFVVELIDLYEGRPEYLRVFTLTYLLGLAYERIVNGFSVLRRYRVVMIIVLRRRQSDRSLGGS